jgi:hypothetical protein
LKAVHLVNFYRKIVPTAVLAAMGISLLGCKLLIVALDCWTILLIAAKSTVVAGFVVVVCSFEQPNRVSTKAANRKVLVFIVKEFD